MLFPGRGPLPLAGRSQREGDKGCSGLLEREEAIGAGRHPVHLGGRRHGGTGCPCHRQHACLYPMPISLLPRLSTDCIHLWQSLYGACSCLHVHIHTSSCFMPKSPNKCVYSRALRHTGTEFTGDRYLFMLTHAHPWWALTSTEVSMYTHSKEKPGQPQASHIKTCVSVCICSLMCAGAGACVCECA